MVAALGDTVRDCSVRALVCDVLSPGDRKEELSRALSEAEAIIDFSASTAVSRHLALDLSSRARRVSFFLSPNGRFLVMLAEDTSRAINLDELEAQFYRILARETSLWGFYRENRTSLRYGGACSDVSMHIRPERVAVHAGLAAGALQQLPDTALVSIWRLTEELSVEHHQEAAASVRWFKEGAWEIGIDSQLVAHLILLRRTCLPSETGGILVGAVDTHRKRILVVDALDAPPDSQQWPTAFIRGSVGLRVRTEEVQDCTGQAVHYIGEWHSHPQGASLGMSPDDRKVLAFVTKHMRAEGLPGLVLIVGEAGVQCHARER
jgi:hypothetical protein